jgi:ribosomal RNA assembly protein
MVQIYVEHPKKILQNKKKLEQDLKIKFHIKDNILITNEGAKPEKELIANQVFEAINLGFKVPDALLLVKEDYEFRKVNIKDVTKRGNLKAIRGRVIGTRGKALETIEKLTDSIIFLHDNTVGIIGRAEDIANTEEAIEKLIKGSKHGQVYGFIHRYQDKPENI